jgi:putative endopeptidase
MVHSIRFRLCLVAVVAIAGTASAGQPRIGSYGFDATGMNTATRPGNDFDDYANGAWTKRTVIPGDHAYWGVWDELELQSRTHVRDILEEAARAHAPAGSNARKIGDYYAAFMDEAAIEKSAAAPLQQRLKAIAAIGSYTALAKAMGEASRIDDAMPFSIFVIPDFKHPEVNVAYVDQGGLGLPDREYYLSDDPAMAEARTAYLGYAAKLLRLAGVARDDAGADARAKAVFDLEHHIAEVQWSRVRQRDLPARYVPWNQEDYRAKAPGFDWPAWFRALGVANQPVLVASVDSSIIGTAALIMKTPLPVWRDYLAIRAIDRHAPFLAKAFAAAHFAFHDTALAGTPDQEVRWKRSARYTSRALGEAIGEVYVHKHFGAEAKASVRQIVGNLLAAAGRRIDALAWMSPETRARAREKLATFQVKVGYPDKWRDYAKLKVVAGDAYGNALAADRFEFERNLAKLGQPVDRSEWGMTPMTVNAYYDPTKNEIVFPAAVLQPPFFDPDADLAVNYGGIGAIIGHEISHGFDNQGRLFDAHGALSDWWTPADADQYKVRTAAFVAQYSAYQPVPGLKLNGELTLGENIADNAGLVIAYDAYHAVLGGQAAPVIDGQTGDQRFLLGFAQDWRTVWREQILRQLVTTDEHSPDAIRVRSVRNFDPWYAAFGVQQGEALYLAPAERIRIW